MKKTYYLNGLHCANCAAKIEDAIKNDAYFNNVEFSFATKRLVVESEEQDAKDKIQDIVDHIEDGVSVDLNAGYMEHHHGHEHGHVAGDWKSVLISNQLSIAGAVLLIGLVIFHSRLPYNLVGYLTAYILIGGDIVKRAIKNLFHGQVFDENFLMTLATVGAFFLGEYVEAVSVMLFYKIGEGFQDYAVDYSRRNIESLINIKAEYANRITGRVVEQVDPSDLNIGDMIVIKAGEKVPVDCIVMKGQANVDASALTGESLPQVVAKGDALLSGSVVNDAVIEAKVEKLYEDSTVAKILDLVQNATAKKAKTEQFITKFARVYTPIVVVAALLIALIPPTLGYSTYSDWISRSLIFLVISCPCALVISVPLGYFGGLGSASRHGILIKGGNYLDAMNDIDTVVFDKTGTLTEGRFVVNHVSDDRTLELAAMMEVHSNHPIAASILSAYEKEVDYNKIKFVRETAGEGLTGMYKDEQLIVGNERIMKRYNIDYLPSTKIGTNIYVAYKNEYVGFININDQIKEASKALIESLGDQYKTVMLTGDHRGIAEYVANKLNIKQVHSQLLPQDKLDIVEGFVKNGEKVLFVGDGINDAPVLARADIGIAMGGIGSDAAIEAADMVLMNDNPAKLVEGFKVAKKTRQVVMQNIVFALAIKLFFLSLGALGEANMYQAIFADVGVALLAVLNSMRTLK